MEPTGVDHVDVFLVDNDVQTLSIEKRLLERARYFVVAYSSAPEFLRRAILTPPCCVVVGLQVPAMGGLEINAALARRGSLCSVVLLSEGNTPASVQATRAGAARFLTKPFGRSELVAAVASAVSRSGRALLKRREAAGRARETLSRLSPRELEVASLLARGLSSREIGERCGISERTVKNQRVQVMRKLGVTSVVGLIQLIEKVGGDKSEPQSAGDRTSK